MPLGLRAVNNNIVWNLGIFLQLIFKFVSSRTQLLALQRIISEESLGWKSDSFLPHFRVLTNSLA